MFFSKSVVTAGILVLAPAAEACIRVYAKGMAGLSSSLSIKVSEDDVRTCDVRVDTDGGTEAADCGNGVAIGFDWGKMGDPLPVVYSPADRLPITFEVPNYGCDVVNCCGGNIPCSCNICEYEVSVDTTTEC